MKRRAELEDALHRLAPRIPRHEWGAVLDHAEDSEGLRRASPETAVWLSLVAYVRHTFTDYDALLEEGYERDAARHFVAQDMKEVLGEWGVRRPLSEDE